ncbi:pyrroline-5-carboxylate reductase [Betaproteobacteria bacterium]|nr:pyrroline-5-carboxylate reductase [Betaproteobacteria bacterium]GHT99845.1 pyrroline-5-carboxylate reductase [Betaproteobacteria bacterium]GHU19056.1 pyrroline-5-carboxylate reductase [Betaproteobacteria bacterium]
MKIGFLGGGNMATALIGGMIERGFAAADIRVVELDPGSRERLEARFGVTTTATPDARVFAADVVVLAVKPQQMKAALASFAGQVHDALVISIAAGLRLADIGRWLGKDGAPCQRLVRCMPNMPALIGAGITGMYAVPTVDDAGREAAAKILAAVGATVWVEEEAQLDAVTGISGSGPAYVFHFIEALEAAGVAQGFDAVTARRLAIETVLGSARLAAASDDTPATLREKVTSKGGTTAAALARLAEAGWHDALLDAVNAASVRGRELGEQFGKD